MDDKIKDLTIVLLESVETTRLDARARLFLKWGHLVQTIHATVAIMELAPSSASHYLHTGMLDPFKDITHQWSSVDSIVLKQVLRMHPWFQQLVKTQTAAYGINSNHINIISKLPSYTVMQNIVPRILDDEIVFNLVDPGSTFDVWHTWNESHLGMTRSMTLRRGFIGGWISACISHFTLHWINDSIASTWWHLVEYHQGYQLVFEAFDIHG